MRGRSARRPARIPGRSLACEQWSSYRDTPQPLKRRGFFGYGSIESQPLNPGDAVVVPSQLDYETWGRALVRNLKDWTQIFYQFGLGAAAIKTLRQ